MSEREDLRKEVVGLDCLLGATERIEPYEVLKSELSKMLLVSLIFVKVPSWVAISLTLEVLASFASPIDKRR